MGSGVTPLMLPLSALLETILVEASTSNSRNVTNEALWFMNFMKGDRR